MPIHHKLNRRSLLLAATSGFLGFLSPMAWSSMLRKSSQLFINTHDWLPIEYESTSLEIVGSTANGMELLPNFHRALTIEVARVARIEVARDSMHNMHLVNGCGLFTVYTLSGGVWKKYRLWNYLCSELPDYSVTHAGRH